MPSKCSPPKESHSLVDFTQIIPSPRLFLSSQQVSLILALTWQIFLKDGEGGGIFHPPLFPFSVADSMVAPVAQDPNIFALIPCAYPSPRTTGLPSELCLTLESSLPWGFPLQPSPQSSKPEATSPSCLFTLLLMPATHTCTGCHRKKSKTPLAYMFKPQSVTIISGFSAVCPLLAAVPLFPRPSGLLFLCPQSSGPRGQYSWLPSRSHLRGLPWPRPPHPPSKSVSLSLHAVFFRSVLYRVSTP